MVVSFVVFWMCFESATEEHPLSHFVVSDVVLWMCFESATEEHPLSHFVVLEEAFVKRTAYAGEVAVGSKAHC